MHRKGRHIKNWLRNLTNEQILGLAHAFENRTRFTILNCQISFQAREQHPAGIGEEDKRIQDGVQMHGEYKCLPWCSAAVGSARSRDLQTVDLWERQNLNSVVICLQSLGRKVLDIFELVPSKNGIMLNTNVYPSVSGIVPLKCIGFRYGFCLLTCLRAAIRNFVSLKSVEPFLRYWNL